MFVLVLCDLLKVVLVVVKFVLVKSVEFKLFECYCNSRNFSAAFLDVFISDNLNDVLLVNGD